MSKPTTTNRGLTKVSTTSPDYKSAGFTADFSANFDALDAALGVEVESASGAMGIKEGSAVITKSTAAALTLVAPTAGLPAAGGDDGKILRIVSTTAAAHTVTTPSNKINGASHIATFAAAIGNFQELIAYNGVWYALASAGITLS